MNRHGWGCIPVGLLAVSVLTACGASAPIRYYTLQPVAATTSPVPAGSGVPLRLEPVTIPAELDRPGLVVRAAPYRLDISDSDRWAASLEDQIRRVLSDDLAMRLPARSVVDPLEAASSEPRRLLSVAIVEFYVDASCATLLRADWSLRGPDGAGGRGSERVQVPGSGSCSGAVAAAMSAALGQLADRLAAAVQTR